MGVSRGTKTFLFLPPFGGYFHPYNPEVHRFLALAGSREEPNASPQSRARQGPLHETIKMSQLSPGRRLEKKITLG